MEIIIRKAQKEEAEFVSQCVLAAVNLYDFKEESVEGALALGVCGREDTLYSYRNARVALVDGKPAGCLVDYDGARYEEMRRITFAIFREAGRAMDDTETEAYPGEYYLDSMAIRPEYRGLGIGHLLMMDAINDAHSRGFEKVSLIVECSKPQLRDYYAKLGFKPERTINAFGDDYLRMIL